MDQETKQGIIILALDNLINTYKDALEVLELTQEEKDLANELIQASEYIKAEMLNPQIKRPQWNKEI